MEKNIKGFSIVIVLGLIIVINLIVIGILSYIVPFGRDSKGIENASVAYYEANKGIENALWEIKNSDLWSEPSDSLDTTSVDFSYEVVSTGSVIPLPGEGNSEFDSDWNIISPGNPIQLSLFDKNGDNIPLDFWDNLLIDGSSATKFYFRVPDMNNDGSNIDQQLSTTNLKMINWMISGKTVSGTGSVLIAEDSQITAEEINANGIISLEHNYVSGVDREGKTLEGTILQPDGFYKGIPASEGITQYANLKLSIINDLVLDDGTTKIPYLEYKIVFVESDVTGDPGNVPLFNTDISASGKSYGFKKDLNIKIPQNTVNEAFDFTVFQ